MKRLLFILIVAVIGFLSCTGGADNVSIPSEIIKPDTLVKIFVDFQLAEAAIQMKQEQKQEIAKFTGVYYSMILQKYNLSRTDFDNSLKFYSNHPKLLRKIYDNVLTDLSTKQGRSMERPRVQEE